MYKGSKSFSKTYWSYSFSKKNS